MTEQVDQPPKPVAKPKPKRRPKRRIPAVLKSDKPQYGPMMQALPNDRWRAFVAALYQVKPGHGAQTAAARLAGFGHANSKPEVMQAIASRLAHDPRVQAALYEEDQKQIRAAAPRAIRAVNNLIEDPTHKDHARGVAMVLDRIHPAETQHTVKVEHQASSSFKATAEAVERILKLAAQFGAPMPPIIDITPEKSTS